MTDNQRNLLKQMNETSRILGSAVTSPAMNNLIKQRNETSRILGSAVTSPAMNNLIKQMNETSRILGSTVTSPAMNNLIKQMNETSKVLGSAINSLPIEDILAIANTIQQMTISIPNFAEIDWDTIDFTDSDIEKVEEIISNENIDDAISEEINQDITASQPPNSILFIMIFLVYFIMSSFSLLDFSLVNIENLDISVEFNINEKIPSVESNVESEESSKKIPEKHIVNRIQKKIKLKIPQIFLGSVGIITKSIYIYKKKRLDSKRIGKLNSFVVVKIIKQNRNWTYILLQDSDGNIILKGWTLTRYIQKIK